MASTGKKVGAFVSVALSLAILIYLGLTLDWKSFSEQLSRLRWEYLPHVVIFFSLPFYVRALRWRHLLPSSSAVTTRGLFDATLVGTLATCILPLRAGEFVRPWVLSRWENVKFSTGFASVVTERVFDIFALLVLLLASLPQIPNLPDEVALGLKSLFFLASLIALVMLWAYLHSQSLIRLGQLVSTKVLDRISHGLSVKAIRLLEEFVEGLRGIASIKELFYVVIYSMIIWMMYSLGYQAALWAFGEFPSLWVGVIVNVMIAIAIAAPSAPGFVGTYQLGCILALSVIFGHSKEFAVAYSLVGQTLSLGAVFVGGFIVLSLRGLALGDLTGAKEQD